MSIEKAGSLINSLGEIPNPSESIRNQQEIVNNKAEEILQSVDFKRTKTLILNDYATYNQNDSCKKRIVVDTMDSYGYFEKKWQFSADLIRRGFDIIEVSDDTQFLDGNISRLTEETDKYVLRANAKGKPEYINKTIDGITYKAIQVGDSFYIPQK